MGIRALPVLCIIFLFFTSSMVLPYTEAGRTLEESKAAIGYRTLTPARPPPPPHYRRSCEQHYKCFPPETKP